MTREITDKLVGYHYTNTRAYRSMRDGLQRGQRALLPLRRLVSLDYAGLPNEAYAFTVQGLLEPEPASWTQNPRFPQLWRSLMIDIRNAADSQEVKLLSFEILPTDDAYVVERAHVEEGLYHSGWNDPDPREMKNAYLKYWGSRIPIANYWGDFVVPQLTIWSPIAFDRLKVEWTKPADTFFDEILAKGW